MADAAPLVGPSTRVINGQGHTVMPGFIDSHFHLQWGAATLYGAQLMGIHTLDGIYAALNRQPWQPGQNAHQQTLAETLRSYTADTAYVEFQEGQKGQLKTGQWADLILLDQDIFALPSDEIADVQVDLTICNGRVVFER